MSQEVAAPSVAFPIARQRCARFLPRSWLGEVTKSLGFDVWSVHAHWYVRTGLSTPIVGVFRAGPHYKDSYSRWDDHPQYNDFWSYKGKVCGLWSKLYSSYSSCVFSTCWSIESRMCFSYQEMFRNSMGRWASCILFGLEEWRLVRVFLFCWLESCFWKCWCLRSWTWRLTRWPQAVAVDSLIIEGVPETVAGRWSKLGTVRKFGWVDYSRRHTVVGHVVKVWELCLL